MVKFLNNEPISDLERDRSLAECTRNMQLMPVFCGSAKMELGIEQLLNGIIQLLPEAKHFDDHEFHAKVFKVEHDKTLGRIAYIRIFQGRLSVRDSIFNQRLNREEKVAQIFRLSGKKNQDLNMLVAGDIAMVSGMSDVHPGDILGHQTPKMPDRAFQEPVLQVKLNADNKQDTQNSNQSVSHVFSYRDSVRDFRFV